MFGEHMKEGGHGRYERMRERLVGRWVWSRAGVLQGRRGGMEEAEYVGRDTGGFQSN